MQTLQAVEHRLGCREPDDSVSRFQPGPYTFHFRSLVRTYRGCDQSRDDLLRILVAGREDRFGNCSRMRNG